MTSMESQQLLLQKYLSEAKASLAQKPKGALTICKSHNHDQYFFRDSPNTKKGIYIPKKNQDLIRDLAQKDYDIRFIKAAENTALILDRLIRMQAFREIHYLYEDLGSVYQKLSESRKDLVHPYVLPDDLYVLNWESKVYQGRGFSEESPWFYTEKQERVRSKSEVIIANMLHRYRIPYRYEYPIVTKSLGTLYPDFMLLDLWNRQELLFEHFGMLHDESYRRQVKAKMETYAEEGYFPHQRFLFTMETDNSPLNMHYLLEILKDRFPHVFFQ